MVSATVSAIVTWPGRSCPPSSRTAASRTARTVGFSTTRAPYVAPPTTLSLAHYTQLRHQGKVVGPRDLDGLGVDGLELLAGQHVVDREQRAQPVLAVAGRRPGRLPPGPGPLRRVANPGIQDVAEHDVVVGRVEVTDHQGRPLCDRCRRTVAHRLQVDRPWPRPVQRVRRV